MKKTLPILALGLGLLLFSNGRWVVPAAAWLAPIFLIRWFRQTKAVIALPLGAVFFMAAARPIYFGIIPSGLGAMTYALTAYFGLLLFAPYVIDRILAPRIRGLRASFVFPAAAVTVEYVNALVFGDWGSTAFTQRGSLVFVQLASLAGLWGLTFLVSWLGPLINAMWEAGWKRRVVGRAAGAFAAVAASALLFGGARISLFPPKGPTVRIAALTLPGETTNDGTALSILLDQTAASARAGAKIVLWPESAVEIPASGETELLARGKEAAQKAGIYLLMGYFVEGPDSGGRGRNKAALIDPKGEVLWEYLKSHPVPGSTDVPGDKKIPVVDTPFGRIGSAICYDLDFPALIRQAGKKDVDIMLVPGWDWPAINPLHTEMAVIRAVENGFSMVRATEDGLSIAVDYQGRVLAAMDDERTTENVLTADVPARGVGTLYDLIGDAFAWLCAAVLIGLLAMSRKKRTLLSPAPAARAD
jgi:apolipoprotein N-acyltransferase